MRHGSIINNARLWADRIEIPDGAGWLLPLPLFHTGGCVVGVLGALDRRATLVLMPMFEPGLFLELIELERPWFANSVPTMLIAAMDHPDASRRDLSSWRSTASGGAQVPEALVRRMEEALGVDFTIVFGQTECAPLLTSTFPSDSAEDKGLTVGPPLPHTEVRIVDPVSLQTVPIGTPGELWARGYFTMLGYFDMPEKSAETLRADGWLRTGDLATMDERGYCRIVGRLKDMIIRGGENLFPAEIEEVLYHHPAVAEVAVVGLPDERWGEVVGAFIRPRDPDAPPTVTELSAHLRSHLSPQKTPTRWYAVDGYPLTGPGKIKKFAIREAWERGEHAGNDAQRLDGRAPEDDQLANAAGQAESQRDDQAPPAVQQVVQRGVAEERVVQAQLARPERRHRDRRRCEYQVVFPAFLDDEEAVGAVHGPRRHQHQRHEPGGGDRREQPGRQPESGRHLGGRGDPGMEGARLHADALEPAGRAGDAATAEELVVAVRGHGQP